MAAGEGTLQNQAGAEIVLTKWIGMEGMLRIAEEREEELRQRFAPVFLRQIQSYRDGETGRDHYGAPGRRRRDLCRVVGAVERDGDGT